MAIHTSQFSLTCYRVDCRGEFRYCGDESGDLLYECRECGASLCETGVRQLATDDGPVGQLASLLLKERVSYNSSYTRE